MAPATRPSPGATSGRSTSTAAPWSSTACWRWPRRCPRLGRRALLPAPRARPAEPRPGSARAAADPADGRRPVRRAAGSRARIEARVEEGYQGGAMVEKHKEYWRKNHATWLNQPQPYVTNVEMDLDFEPTHGPSAPRASTTSRTAGQAARLVRRLRRIGLARARLDHRRPPLAPRGPRPGSTSSGLPRPLAPGRVAAPRLPLPRHAAGGDLEERRLRHRGRVHPSLGGDPDRPQPGLRAGGRLRRTHRGGREEPLRAADLSAPPLRGDHRRGPRPLGLHPEAPHHHARRVHDELDRGRRPPRR